MPMRASRLGSTISAPPPVRGTRYGGGTETLTVAVKVDQAGRPGSPQWQSQS